MNHKAVDPKSIDWNQIGFNYIQTKSHIRYTWKNDHWDQGQLINEPIVNLHIGSTVLHYGQSCFEGLKAFQMKDGKIRLFRPELNAERFIQSCQAICVEPPSKELFLQALERVVLDNIDFVPPYGSNGSLYIRPFIIGSGIQIGLSPADEYYFMIMVVPVGDYYQGGMGSPVKALVMHGFDRAAPNGTGNVKLGGNYAPALGPTLQVKKKGYQVMLFLDPKESKYVEEFATSNFAALTPKDPITKKRTYVTSKSKSILPSITNRSLLEMAEKKFGWHVERRQIEWEELIQGKFEEYAACGTAVIITPVSEIHREKLVQISKMTNKEGHNEEDVENEFIIEKAASVSSSFEGFKSLYVAYRAIQYGDDPDWANFDWMWPKQGLSI